MIAGKQRAGLPDEAREFGGVAPKLGFRKREFDDQNAAGF